MTLAIIPLSKMIEEWALDDIYEKLRDFTCSKDAELETFLHSKALMFEKRDRSRTYLFFHSDKIVGYISLGLTILNVERNLPISDALKRKMDIKNKSSATFLIGQLCKADDYEEKIGPDMLNLAMSMFQKVKNVCGGRIICIDCKKELVRYYENHDFKLIYSPDDDLCRMVRII